MVMVMGVCDFGDGYGCVGLWWWLWVCVIMVMVMGVCDYGDGYGCVRG